jgi:alpha-L-rhamnosidase
MSLYRYLALGLLMAGLCWIPVQVTAASIDDPLRREFISPSNAAKPRVWWHWMNGNVTKEGIRLDLEWMSRVGIGGVDCIDASIATPQVVQQRLIYMSAGWKDAFRYAAGLADHLGMELAVDSSPGWSETGGPWVKPAQAMKKLVWSTTLVRGGRHFEGRLASPPTTTGPFQNIAYDASTTDGGTVPRQFYADVGVAAYRLPAGTLTSPRMTVTSSAGPIDASLLNDGDLQKSVSLAAAADGTAWVQITYDHPQIIRSAVIATPFPAAIMAVTGPMTGHLEAQDKRGAWHAVATLRITNVPQVTVSFHPVAAKVFRLLLAPGAARELPFSPVPGADTSMLSTIGWRTPTPNTFSLSELSLQPWGKVNEFERKAGFAVADDYDALATPEDAANALVPTADVLDLSSKMTPDGSLEWTPPPGQWVVLRLGYSLTGKTNNPATPEATGLEVDKLHQQWVQKYMDNYLDTFSSFLPASLMGAHGLQAVMLDSTEVGPQNWTDDMLEQFQRLRGYDPRPWLPALTGVIVESARKTDKFLWDFRNTIAQLTVEAHYATVATVTHARGLIQYGEALELGRPVLGDDMQMRRFADVPTGAMWVHSLDQGPLPSYLADDRGAASVAHLYGQNLAAAESLTSAFAPWAFSPRDLKPIVDLEFALGINRIIVHSSVHQPAESPPGLSLAIFGQFFNRHETWAEEAGPWVSYLTRSSFLLQQGRFAADVAYFYGEETPLTILQTQGRLNDVPKAYAFDFVNADAMLHLVDVRDGYVVTPSGTHYRVLQLGGSSVRMTLPVLRRLKELVEKGATVAGAAPIDSPSLADDKTEWERIKRELWGRDRHGTTLGLGHVYGTGTVDEALSSGGLAPDFTYSRPHADTELLFVHRDLPDSQIFYLTNRRNQEEVLEVSFRVAGRAPELWHAQSGQTEPVSFRIQNGRTVIPLKLNPYDAVFVVFRGPALTSSLVTPEPTVEFLGELKGSWTLSFPPGRGAPATIGIDRLESWSVSVDPGVKYFSGTATYSKVIEAPGAWLRSGVHVVLDLGEVRELAEVSLNGKSLGILWTPPFRVDVTDALRPGANRLDVKVTNLWVNRLIGDQQPDATPYTFTTIPTYVRTAPLHISGLLGPVTIIRKSAVGL